MVVEPKKIGWVLHAQTVKGDEEKKSSDDILIRVDNSDEPGAIIIHGAARCLSAANV